MKELKENELSFATGGKNIEDIVDTLIPLTTKYPEIIEIVNAYNKGNYSTLLTLLQAFHLAHPELSDIFN